MGEGQEPFLLLATPGAVSELQWVGVAEKAAAFVTFLLGCLLSLPPNPVQCRMQFLHRFLTQPSNNKNKPRKNCPEQITMFGILSGKKTTS